MGSVGQALLPLIVSWLIASFDWRITLLIVTSMLVPMAFCIPFLRADHKKITEDAPVYLQQTILQAFGHSSFLMLSAGFFVCGFHLAFITAHLPNYVQNFCTGTQLSPEELRALGLRALALAGFANIFGTLLASRLGGIFPKPYVLAMIYVLRAIIILGFVSLPVTPTSVMIFGFLMGGLWLSTVPLTSALVLVMFGPRVMGTLFGFVFLSHQLGGFVGVWLGGIWFDRFDSYDAVWFLAIVLGLLSALLHLLVRERSALAAA
jgi:predicted MFS family arabinose efflux permease